MPWLSLTLEVEAGEAEAVSEALLEAEALAVSIDDPDAERCRVSALLAQGVDAAALVVRLFATPPRMKLVSLSRSRCSGMLVRIPSTTISESAMRMRLIACSRFAPYAITLPTIES